ncbi:hypothetical protein DKY63_23235 [Pseudomonas putida]|uniref:Uncharacterized protein n=1 Tax=Pseudomonas putida TaxID=303 RepID=A0A2Z4RNE8_PSEPU|nr:hypothetical protein DKY63_23235 [Pseudomonas putida]
MGMPQGTLRVPAFERDAERPWLRSHAERGNDLCGQSCATCARLSNFLQRSDKCSTRKCLPAFA